MTLPPAQQHPFKRADQAGDNQTKHGQYDNAGQQRVGIVKIAGG